MPASLYLFGLAALLLTPGPTNTLMFAAGALDGPAKAARLVGAEMAAYLVAVLALGGLVGARVASAPLMLAGLKVALALYLAHAAVRLWRRPRVGVEGVAGIGLRQVFVTTLLNPKSLVIAFVLMPQGWTGDLGIAAAHLLVLCLAIPLAAAGWIGAGALLGASVEADAGLVSRAAATALATFSMLIAGSLLPG